MFLFMLGLGGQDPEQKKGEGFDSVRKFQRLQAGILDASGQQGFAREMLNFHSGSYSVPLSGFMFFLGWLSGCSDCADCWQYLK